MSTAEQMLESYPKDLRHIDPATLLACTDLDCATACLRCERAGRELFSALD
ncbi:hypothetical protein ACH47B_38170 [Rhodococcus sp. NPDC019627]|uniref:hypothetical protein n=1 Tax=unclassified Rhodococcus (in: high G+C Gram-positive bacteria) TaxID=192944 RepID=UPI0033D04B69